MERDGAVEMFLQSIDKNNLKYSEYIGDDNFNSFGAVKKALGEKYGDEYVVRKQDCIRHIKKRMGSALRAYKSNRKGSVLPDGKTVDVVGRFTDKIIGRIQTYYGYAVQNNKGNDEKIVKAIWAIFYHSILGPSYESFDAQLFNCPDGEDSWCKYEKDLLHGTTTYDRKKCLPFVSRGELKPIFERLSSSDFLNSCKQGLTQNQNELLNNVLWTKCSKRVFIEKETFTIAVCEAITAFNDGTRSTKTLFEKLKLACGQNTTTALNVRNNIRLRNSRYKVSEIYQKQPQSFKQKVKSRAMMILLICLVLFHLMLHKIIYPLKQKKPRKIQKIVKKL